MRPPVFGAPWLIGLYHGILTGRTSPTWPDYGRAWFAAVEPLIQTITDYYKEWIFPRVAAIRNQERIRRNVSTFLLQARLTREKRGRAPRMDFGGHSNGGILAVGTAREMIAEGYRVESIILMAPALRAKETSRELSDWIDRGMLGRVLLVRATKDRTLGLAKLLPRIVCWPWGVLGLLGWDETVISESAAAHFYTLDLAEGHTEFLQPDRREETFETIIGPWVVGDLPEGAHLLREEAA